MCVAYFLQKPGRYVVRHIAVEFVLNTENIRVCWGGRQNISLCVALFSVEARALCAPLDRYHIRPREMSLYVCGGERELFREFFIVCSTIFGSSPRAVWSAELLSNSSQKENV